MFKQAVLLIGASLLIASYVAAVDLIELNDVNRNKLNMDTLRALEAVQNAISIEYKFERVADAKKFLVQCKLLENLLDSAQDTDYEGLASQMKAIIAQPELKELCDIEELQLNHYASLDHKVAPLSKSGLERFVALDNSLQQQPKVNRLLSHLFERKTRHTGSLLLKQAAEDTTILFGELAKSSGFFSSPDYLTGCSISSINPICKLVRGIPSSDVVAYGIDLTNFRELLVANDEQKLQQLVEASGVSMKDLEIGCALSKGSLYPMEHVNRYLEAKYLDQSQVEEQKKTEEKFAFYYELERLCKV